MNAPTPHTRNALTIAACVVIGAVVLAMVAHLLGQPSA